MPACAHLAHGDRWPCRCFGVHRRCATPPKVPAFITPPPVLPQQKLQRRPSPTIDQDVAVAPNLDQDVAVAPNLDRRECPMRAPARQPTIPPFPIGGNFTVLVRGARVKDLIRRLRSAPGRRRGRR
jgi:hypothetical protein